MGGNGGWGANVMVLVMLENVDVGSDFVVSILSKKLKRGQGENCGRDA